MSADQQTKQEESQQPKEPGFCSATPVTKKCLLEEINAPDLKTSDLFHVCELPKRFEHPHWFNGYGCQVSKQHPFYRTSANEYGWFPPGYHSVPAAFYPKNQKFSNTLGTFGMYRIHSVPSVFFPAGQTFTNRLAAAGMYRNYSLNTGMDPAGYV